MLSILSFWALSEIPQALKEILETLEVTIHNIQLQTLTLPQSYNFNPFERRIPFLRSHSGIAVKSFAGGMMLSGLILISIIGAIFYKDKRINIYKRR